MSKIMNPPGFHPHGKPMQLKEEFMIEVTETKTAVVTMSGATPSHLRDKTMDHLNLFRNQIVVGTWVEGQGLDMDGMVIDPDRVKENIQKQLDAQRGTRRYQVTALGTAPDNL